MAGFSLIDGAFTFKPAFGPNAGKTYTYEAQQKVGFDPGTKRSVAKGRRENPVYIVTGSAEPKLTFEWSSAAEAWRAWEFYCGGRGVAPLRGNYVTFSGVFSRPGLQIYSWRWFEVPLLVPGFDASDSGVTSKMDTLCTDAHLNGATVYER